MFPSRLHLVTGLLALFLAGCADPRAKGENALREVGAEALRKDADLLYKDLFGGRANDFQVVRRPSWPKSFQRLQPLRVGAYPDGFSIALSTVAGREEGIYVVPQHLERRQKGAGDARYQQLEDGIFWYRFGD